MTFGGENERRLFFSLNLPTNRRMNWSTTCHHHRRRFSLLLPTNWRKLIRKIFPKKVTIRGHINKQKGHKIDFKLFSYIRTHIRFPLNPIRFSGRSVRSLALVSQLILNRAAAAAEAAAARRPSGGCGGCGGQSNVSISPPPLFIGAGGCWEGKRNNYSVKV